MSCPLCNIDSSIEFFANGKKYFKCKNCNLIYIHSDFYLEESEEYKRYSFHQNSIADSGYVKFLEQIINPALNYINSDMQGLDFGCGPNPVLAQILSQKGFSCDFYDPYFFNNIDLTKQYDFIFATECFEHFFSPQKELELICSLLKPKGILCIMTEFHKGSQHFPDWYYTKDPTHVCFYNLQSFDFICRNYKMKKLFSDGRRGMILIKG